MDNIARASDEEILSAAERASEKYYDFRLCDVYMELGFSPHVRDKWWRRTEAASFPRLSRVLTDNGYLAFKRGKGAAWYIKGSCIL